MNNNIHKSFEIIFLITSKLKEINSSLTIRTKYYYLKNSYIKMLIDIFNEILQMFVEMSPYILLGLFFVGILNMYFNKNLIIRHTGKNNFLSVLKASLFGIPLPLCSCGVIPTSVFMSKNGASKGSTVSFLTSTPQTGIDSIIATYGMMGGVFALFRPFAALIMGIISGTLVKLFDKTERNRFIELDTMDSGDSCSDDSCSPESNNKNKKIKQKIKNSSRYAFVEFLDDISVQFIIGVIISGLIAYFLPADLIKSYSIQSGIIAMVLVSLFAAPMYVCATASIPIAVTLMMKGFSPGVAFVFLAVGPATNAASLSVLTKALGYKITTVYLISLVILSILMGYLLDYIFNYFTLDPVNVMSHSHEGIFFTPEVKVILSVLFVIMLGFSLKRKYFNKFTKSKVEEDMKEYKIEGMSCNHCVMNVKNAINDLQGVEKVDVDLGKNKAYVEGDVDDSKIKEKVEAVGYKVVG